ncbi:nucleolar protein 11 [Aricia agestis]|uniref:nucleolar protein 11 n=1 Tax=Aricia agestis TaxID=91739 RepID=UPI001C204D78|nr:nucleolar protein 11 [Aricia agestis]
MAKLHSYYVLCPLIDRNSFLGVSEDSDQDNCIVSLGRNVINKYRLSDQKQISGWTSKDHLTSPVIFDKDQESYVGVFNKNSIKIWKEDSDNLDKIKKYKFSVNILKILPRQGSSLIIFENGNCASLSYALENRKTFENQQLIKDTEKIVSVTSYSAKKSDYVCYIIQHKKNYEILCCPLRDELGDMDKSKINRVKVARDEAYVVGKLISTKVKPCVYFLWNDGKITAYELAERSWRTVGTVPWISTSNNVSIAWMGKDHLILFGSNQEQDGALLVAYNIVLGVGSCKYPMKMYSEDAQIYTFNNYIILEASNHVGMLPFALETNRNLSSLLGSHDVVQDNSTNISDWDTPVEPVFEVTNEIKEFIASGMTERSICAQIINPLLENQDFRPIYRNIKQFNDIPESVLLSVMNYVLKLLSKESLHLSDDEAFDNFCNCKDMAKKDELVHKGKFELLNYLLQIQFSDAVFIPYLRSAMSLDNALFLMRYISYLLLDSNKTFDSVYESKLFDWCTLLMDAFYQQYLLTKDETVSHVLDTMHKTIVNLVNQLMIVDDTLPLLHQVLTGKQKEDNQECLSYAIELMDI